MSGPDAVLKGFCRNQAHPDRGVIPRAVAQLFADLDEAKAQGTIVEYAVHCTYLEVYCDKVYDLLRSNDSNLSNLTIQSAGKDKGQAKGATKEQVWCSAEAMLALERGQKHKHVAPMKMNPGECRPPHPTPKPPSSCEMGTKAARFEWRKCLQSPLCLSPVGIACRAQTRRADIRSSRSW